MSRRGFPDGARCTPVPDLFFSRDLAELGDPVALAVLLVVLWRVHRRAAGAVAALSEPALRADPTLGRTLTSLGVADADRDARLAAAVDALVAAGSLLQARVAADDGPVRWLLVNGREGRAALQRWRQDERLLADAPTLPAPAAGRPNVYGLYEQNIGLLTPLLAEELRDAEATYPDGWIADAMRLAVLNNARRWSYVRAILERWAREGRDDGTDRQRDQAPRDRDSEGPYAPWVRH